MDVIESVCDYVAVMEAVPVIETEYYHSIFLVNPSIRLQDLHFKQFLTTVTN